MLYNSLSFEIKLREHTSGDVGVKGYIRLLTVGMRMKVTYFWYDEFAQQVNTDMMHTTGE